MNDLAWTELYNKFAAFAYVARRQGFYVNHIQEMEHSISEKLQTDVKGVREK